MMPETDRPDICHAALYARKLSSDLAMPGEPDMRVSEKIKEMKEYLKDHRDIQVTGVYTDTRRYNADHPLPEFQKMIRDIVDGRYSCVVMYSLYTFGRSAEENSSYVRQLFLPMGLRVLSVTDQYDSATSEPEPGKLQRLEELIGQSRSAALSLRNSTQEGKKRAIRPQSPANLPYGYMFDPDSEAKFVIDPVTARYVHYIYDQFVRGVGITDIAESLNSMGAPDPVQRKKELGFQFRRSGLTTFWKPGAVRRILTHRVYIGDYASGRKWATLPLSQETAGGCSGILRNHHEPVISLEQFELAQTLIEKQVRAFHERRRNSPPGKRKTGTSSTRLHIICGDCGRVMTRISRNIFGESRSCYICSSVRFHLDNPCPPRIHPADDTVAAVQEALEQERRLACEIRDKVGTLNASGCFRQLEERYTSDISELMEQERQDSTAFYRLLDTGTEQHRKLKESGEHLRMRLMDLIHERQRIRQLPDMKNPWLCLFTGLEEGFVLSSAIAMKYIREIYLYQDSPMVIEFRQAEEKEEILSALSLIEEAENRTQESG